MRDTLNWTFAQGDNTEPKFVGKIRAEATGEDNGWVRLLLVRSLDNLIFLFSRRDWFLKICGHQIFFSTDSWSANWMYGLLIACLFFVSYGSPHIKTLTAKDLPALQKGEWIIKFHTEWCGAWYETPFLLTHHFKQEICGCFLGCFQWLFSTQISVCRTQLWLLPRCGYFWTIITFSQKFVLPGASSLIHKSERIFVFFLEFWPSVFLMVWSTELPTTNKKDSTHFAATVKFFLFHNLTSSGEFMDTAPLDLVDWWIDPVRTFTFQIKRVVDVWSFVCLVTHRFFSTQLELELFSSLD